MTGPEEYPMLDFLKQQYGFERWAELAADEEALFVWKFFLSEGDLPGYRPERIQPIAAVDDWPESIQSIWRREDDPEALVSVLVIEGPERRAARDLLLRALGEFQGILEPREGIGEVAFAGAGDRALVLALANLVLVVRTAGGKPAPVTGVAETLERDLRNPREPGGRVAPEIETLEAGPPRADGTVQISLEAADPLGRPVWFQLFGLGGELLVRNRELAFRPYGPGPRELTVYAINENKGSSSRRLTLAD